MEILDIMFPNLDLPDLSSETKAEVKYILNNANVNMHTSEKVMKKQIDINFVMKHLFETKRKRNVRFKRLFRCDTEDYRAERKQTTQAARKIALKEEFRELKEKQKEKMRERRYSNQDSPIPRRKSNSESRKTLESRLQRRSISSVAAIDIVQNNTSFKLGKRKDIKMPEKKKGNEEKEKVKRLSVANATEKKMKQSEKNDEKQKKTENKQESPKKQMNKEKGRVQSLGKVKKGNEVKNASQKAGDKQENKKNPKKAKTNKKQPFKERW